MLTPLVGGIEAMGEADCRLPVLADRIVELFVREVYETTPPGRYPSDDLGRTAAFRSLPNSIIARCSRALLRQCAHCSRRAAARGEVPEGLADFPQLIAAPGLVAIVWSGLFERFEPLDVRKMMKAHVELLFAPRRAP